MGGRDDEALDASDSIENRRKEEEEEACCGAFGALAIWETDDEEARVGDGTLRDREEG